MSNIPKILHYCWFGESKFNKLQHMCIETWKRFLPDFEFKLWNETNVDMDHPFVAFAYKNKKWAFISDYIRLQKLYEFGGVYLDTDMFLIKSLDDLLENPCFFGSENVILVSAGIIGAKKNNGFIKECLDYYGIMSPKTWQLNLAIPRIITRKLTGNDDLKPLFHDIITIKGVTVYPSDYFYPMPYDINRAFDKGFLKYKTDNTYAIHLWEGSWVDYSEFQLLRRKRYLEAIKKIIFSSKEIKDFKYFKKIFKTVIVSSSN